MFIFKNNKHSTKILLLDGFRFIGSIINNVWIFFYIGSERVKFFYWKNTIHDIISHNSYTYIIFRRAINNWFLYIYKG